MNRRHDWKHGEPVRIGGRVQADDSGAGDSFRGRAGKVLGDNPVGRSEDGKSRVVNVQLDNGEVVSVPERALDKR